MPDYCGIVGADLGDLIKIRKDIGDEIKFRRMCNLETDTLGYNALHIAAVEDEFLTCKFLIEEVGVDVNVQSDKGDTPLLLAVQYENVNIAKYLISHGAEITTTNYRGLTALHWATTNDLVIMLLKKGADIEADSVEGTPLHFAAKCGRPDIIKVLLKNNAEPDSVSKYLGISPLISATKSDINTVECVKILLNAKADPKKSANGLSPLAHAVEAKSNTCIESLVAAGADEHSVSSLGLRLIEHAAWKDNDEAIHILLLERPDIRHDWSLVNMKNSINSVEAKQRRDEYMRNLKQSGDDAFYQQDYSSAIASYTEAIYHNQKDEKLLANRSLCWARMGKGVFALNDAQQCVELKPDWAKAHLREAAAWHLLKVYRMSADAFKRAFELDLKNEELS
ncbi:hypothetical protein ACS0TY_007430 [Phlomoides rotata]